MAERLSPIGSCRRGIAELMFAPVSAGSSRTAGAINSAENSPGTFSACCQCRSAARTERPSRRPPAVDGQTAPVRHESVAAALTEVLPASGNDLVVLDDGTWTRIRGRRSTPEQRTSPTGCCNEEATARRTGGRADVEFISAILGAFLAGAACRSCPGPVRGADADQWAHSTLNRFTGMGVGHVLSHGTYLEGLSAAEGPPIVKELSSRAPSRAPRRSCRRAAAPVAFLQGTAGFDGTPRTVQLSPDAVLSNLRGLNARSVSRRRTSAAPGCRCTTTWG